MTSNEFAAYTYDAATRITGITQNLWASQAITKVRGTRTLATTSSAVNYALDANGNLTSDGLRAFDYDEANRLSKVKITKDGEAASIVYLHNALGQRVFKGEPKADQYLPNESTLGTGYITWLKKNFAWLFVKAQADASIGTAFTYADEQLPVWAVLGEYDNGSAKGAGRTEYLWLPTDDASQAIPVGMFRNGRFFAIHSDHLGTPRLVTNDLNAPVWQWAYSAFGNNKPTGVLKATTNPRAALTNNPTLLRATTATEFNLRFPGQYADDEAGSFYNLNREYLAGQGRYTQNDPIGFGGGLNRFAYTDANPISYSDPSGLRMMSGMRDWIYGPSGLPFLPGSSRNQQALSDRFEPTPALTSPVMTFPGNPITTTVDIIVEMAKGGKKNIDNEYVRDIQNSGCKDPCAELRRLYGSERDAVERRKIKEAMKRFNCDGKDRFQ